MNFQFIKKYGANWDIRRQQANNIVFITFWSQFSAYVFNTILILFLTRPLLEHGLGYDQQKAYAFIGTSQATGYLIAILGGFMADNVLGVRRAILLGSIFLALSSLLVMLSGFTTAAYGDLFFLASYALLPASNSLLIGTASGLISHIYTDDGIKAKAAMTHYYMAINIGALLATLIAPKMMESRYGPLSILALVFLGKSIAAYNFSKHYSLYEPVIWGQDKQTFSRQKKWHLLFYMIAIYSFILFAYSHIYIANIIISIGCSLGIFWFFIKTLKLQGTKRTKQFIALLLILEAIVFFIIYNQMNSTLILFAKNNSNLQLLGFAMSPAQYQMLNPLLIILVGSQLPRFYCSFSNFTIPYQFASGTLLAGAALLVLAFAAANAQHGYVNGNYIGLTYLLIAFAELFVSAIGLSMIGLYCDTQMLAFAMGVWYLASSLSNTISGRLAGWVALPKGVNLAIDSLPIYQRYYFFLGGVTLGIGFIMLIVAYFLQRRLASKGVNVV